ncbi:unnamed protein product [Eruca vesicaria subsp. sativa]|uniref:Uncharacterized protein n=1 Tax=Eruca vesicaria subsp. sativa TaxID=29727 RepID=A0ABC8KG38_ERUVS|nr:unnamed protein product [Eruca vesicaria subsp. sativa]
MLITFTMWWATPDIRKGERMQLDQLIPNATHNRDGNARIQPFVLDELKEAFELNDIHLLRARYENLMISPCFFLQAEKEGALTIASKSKKKKSESKDKDRNKEKDGEHKKHKHRHKDRTKDKDKDRDRERKKAKKVDTMIRKGSTTGMKMLMTLKGRKRASTRVQRLMRWAHDKRFETEAVETLRFCILHIQVDGGLMSVPSQDNI